MLTKKSASEASLFQQTTILSPVKHLLWRCLGSRLEPAMKAKLLNISSNYGLWFPALAKSPAVAKRNRVELVIPAS